jgi:hypothetical protein
MPSRTASNLLAELAQAICDAGLSKIGSFSRVFTDKSTDWQGRQRCKTLAGD